jgi:hypothetical protein
MSEAEAVACDRRIGEAFQTAGQAMIAAYDDLRTMLSQRGYRRLTNQSTGKRFETWEDYLSARWRMTADRWRQMAGHVTFMRQLGEAAEVENGTAVPLPELTERETRPLRPQREAIVSEVREAVANGTPPEAAIREAIETRRELPTAQQARELARDSGVMVAGSDGLYHDGRTAEEEEREASETGEMHGIYRALETLATTGFSVEAFVSHVPTYERHHIDDTLQNAADWIAELREVWK